MNKRIAVIADIHANIWALNAALDDIDQQGATQIINLGDVLYGPLKPRETFERLKTAPIAITVSGNQDREIYETHRYDSPTFHYVRNDLPHEAIDWLRQLPNTASFEQEMFLCHGTPDSDCTYLLEDVSSGRPLVKAEAAIGAALRQVTHPVILCGHTHIPRLVCLSSNGQLIVNPGSIGLPAYVHDSPVPHAMETYAPHASYAILEKSERGWQVEFRHVAYDQDAAARCAESLHRQDWAHAIRTGRVTSASELSL